MSISLPLKKMSRNDKLRAMEAIWADLSGDDYFESPSWHADALKQSAAKVQSGKAKFSEWDLAKERIRRKASQLYPRRIQSVLR
jgi:hypothetical protein